MPWFQEYPQKRAIDKTTGKDCRYNEGILISELKRKKKATSFKFQAAGRAGNQNPIGLFPA